MTVKIAVSGAHGTGKTTFVHELFSELKKEGLEVGLVTEVARDCNLDIGLETGDYSQSWIMYTLKARESRRMGECNDVVLCDRSVADVLAYQECVVGYNYRLSNACHDWIDTYDIIDLLSPMNEYLVDDGVRPTSDEHQIDIHKYLSEFMENELPRDVELLITRDIDKVIERVKKQMGDSV